LQKSWGGWLWFLALYAVLAFTLIEAVVEGTLETVSSREVDDGLKLDPYQVPILLVVALYATFRSRAVLRSVLFGRLTLLQIVAFGLGGMIVSLASEKLLGVLYGTSWTTAFAFRHGFAITVSLPELLEDILYAPIVEEFAWQGVLQTRLQRLGPIIATIGATIPFVAIHIIDYADSLNPGYAIWLPENFFGLAGAIIVYALIRQYTKSLGAAIIAHGAGNFIILAFYS